MQLSLHVGGLPKLRKDRGWNLRKQLRGKRGFALLKNTEQNEKTRETPIACLFLPASKQQGRNPSWTEWVLFKQRRCLLTLGQPVSWEHRNKWLHSEATACSCRSQHDEIFNFTLFFSLERTNAAERIEGKSKTKLKFAGSIQTFLFVLNYRKVSCTLRYILNSLVSRFISSFPFARISISSLTRASPLWIQ